MKLVNKEVASLAKQIGYDEECNSFYYRDKLYSCDINSKKHPFFLLKEDAQNKLSNIFITNVPYQNQLRDWLREKHGYYIDINAYMLGNEQFFNCTIYKLHFEERANGYAAGDCYEYYYESIEDLNDYYVTFNYALIFTLNLI